MSEIYTPKAADGFDYDDSPQRSPRWLDLHTGRVGASRLGDWLAVSKRDGKPLKARSDYEREIAFEKAFNVPFTKYVTGAMQAGIDNEDFVREQFELTTGLKVEKAGAFYNDYFIASPDGLINDNAGIEIKWLQDSTWTEVVATKVVPHSHHLQIQGNLYANGRELWYYVAANGNTGRMMIIEVTRDEELIQVIADSVTELSNVEPLSDDGVYSFNAQPPTKENVWED